MEVSGQLHTSAALLLGKECLVSIEKDAGWAHSWFGQFRYRRKSLAPVRIWSPYCPSHSMFAVLTVQYCWNTNGSSRNIVRKECRVPRPAVFEVIRFTFWKAVTTTCKLWCKSHSARCGSWDVTLQWQCHLKCSSVKKFVVWFSFCWWDVFLAV